MIELVDSPVTAKAPAAVPPTEALVRLLFGKHISYSLSAVARLGVADHIGESPVQIEELAQKVGAQPTALYRVMRLLVSVGVFEETANRCFSLTSLGELLKTGTPGSLRYMAIQLGDEWSTRPWEHFTEAIRTGADAVNLAFGKNLFELLAEHPEQADHFNRSMTGFSAAMTEPILNAYDFSSVKRLADVGGGHGMLLAAVLRRHPGVQGVVYDLPEVVAGALSEPHFENCGNRIQTQPGSFFERVPGGCDAYMMKFILHDWSDALCKKILECVRRELPPDGRLLVIEQVVTADAGLSTAKLLDIEMLALTVGGKERTVTEFAELFVSAGLQLTNVIQTRSPLCILEARLA